MPFARNSSATVSRSSTSSRLRNGRSFNLRVELWAGENAAPGHSLHAATERAHFVRCRASGPGPITAGTATWLDERRGGWAQAN